VFIDAAFKLWLRDNVMGPKAYDKLEANTTRCKIKDYSSVSQEMMEIMHDFISIKKTFSGQEDDGTVFQISLPSQFEDLTILDDNESPVVDHGQLSLVK
jgi:hypothetical protein